MKNMMLSFYKHTHTNPMNRRIQLITLPIMSWSVFALLWQLPMPQLLADIPFFNWALLAMTGVITIYLTLSLRAGLIAFISAIIFSASYLFYPDMTSVSLSVVAVCAFVAAFILQSVGFWLTQSSMALHQTLLFIVFGPLSLIQYFLTPSPPQPSTA